MRVWRTLPTYQCAFEFGHSVFGGGRQILRSQSSFIEQEPNQSRHHLVNQICRVLSDHRSPQHDLELRLAPFCTVLSTCLVEQVLKRCKNLGFPAHRFFVWAVRIPEFRHSEESYYILVSILGASKQFALLWDFLAELREAHDFVVKPKLFWPVFESYCKAGFPCDAIRAFERMSEFGLKPTGDDRDKLLYFLCKRKYMKEAQVFFDKGKFRFETTAKSFTILIRGWGGIGDLVSARKMFDEMIERGFSVDVHAYNSLLESMCTCEQLDDAYKMFEQMRSFGVEPDAFSYSIFLHAYCKCNDLHSVFRVLDRMKRYNILPNTFTYNGVIRTLCKNDKVEVAYQLLNEMIEKDVSPDSWTYNSILAFHCERSEVNRATKLVYRMVKDGCSPDRHSYNMLLKLLIRTGRFDRATAVWERMRDFGFHPSVSTYSVMIHGLSKKKGKVEDACKYFEKMIDEGIPPYSATIEMLRDKLLLLGLSNELEILARKMERSSSCSIQEQAKAFRLEGLRKVKKQAIEYESG